MSIAVEIMPDANAELAVIVSENRLAPEAAQSLQASFSPLFAEARSVIEKSREITVTDASQKLEIKLAREFRLELRRIRTTGDKLRRELKDESLRRGRAIDGFQNILLHLTAEEEERLDAQEKFVERQEAQRKAQLKASREAALAPYGLDTSFLQLGDMPDDTFAQLLENTRAGHEAKLAAARKVEEDRIRAENERLKEEERIRAENVRLQREAKERDDAARKEREAVAAREKAQREAAEATLRAEREAREKVERELKAERDAEETRKRDEAAAARKAAAAARKAAAAPDREKLLYYARAVRALDLPKFATQPAADVATLVIAQRNKFAAFVEEKAFSL